MADAERLLFLACLSAFFLYANAQCSTYLSLCFNITSETVQDESIRIAFPVEWNAEVLILGLPASGALFAAVRNVFTRTYEPSTEITVSDLPFRVFTPHQLFFRPWPKQIPKTAFAFRVEQLSFDGSRLLCDRSPCYVNIDVNFFNNHPFSGGAGQALYFDGADDHVHAAVAHFPPHALTISMWSVPLSCLLSRGSARDTLQ
eukprot:823750-Rhodomonas_salina.5